MARGRSKAQTVKVVVTGPLGAGKTTFIQSISEIAVLSTERQVTDHTRTLKGHTTVAMDFGRVTVAKDLAIYLFGTPGQERFDFMWEILAEGMLGFVLMVDASRDESLDEAKGILQFFTDIADVPFVVVANKADDASPSVLNDVRDKVGVPPEVSVIECDARDRDSVKEALIALLYSVLKQVERSPEPVAGKA